MDSGKTIKFVDVDTDAEVTDTSELDSVVNEYVVVLILGVACMDTNDEESGSPIMMNSKWFIYSILIYHLLFEVREEE